MTTTPDFRDWTDKELRDLAHMLEGRDFDFVLGFFEELRGAVRPKRRKAGVATEPSP